ncbi:MAG: Lrp/AsnC ligand binding domain-containing protein [Sneathiella sp.]
MKTIFVMVKCELGKAYDVANQAVEQIDKVSEVYSISGKYDLMMKCFLDDDQDIGHFVNEAIHSLEHIQDTFTMITFKAFG